jgi:hypothetical protein
VPQAAACGLGSPFTAAEKRLPQHPVVEANDIESYYLSVTHLHALNHTVSAERIQELTEQATAETAEKSITNIVDLRT